MTKDELLDQLHALHRRVKLLRDERDRLRVINRALTKQLDVLTKKRRAI